MILSLVFKEGQLLDIHSKLPVLFFLFIRPPPSSTLFPYTTLFRSLQQIEIENRLELDESAPIGIGQRFVAGEFAPGERRRTGVQHVLDGLGNQVEGPRGADRCR